MEILYKALEPYPKEYSIEELVRRCRELRYETTMPIRKSILYHLNRFESVEQVK
jgi:hypothetical protein